MVNNLFSFVNWVQDVMREKNISQADIARTGYVRTAAVSMFFSYKTKSVGIDMCRAIAAATGIPLATVYEKAGLLPPSADLTPKKRQLLEMAENVDDDTLDDVIALLEAAVKRKQRQAPVSGQLKKV